MVPIETDPEIRLENQRRITFSWGKVLGQLFIMFALYCGKIMEMVRETENTTKTGKAMIYTVATVIVGTVALVFLTMQIVMLFLDKDTEERRYDRIAEFRKKLADSVVPLPERKRRHAGFKGKLDRRRNVGCKIPLPVDWYR